MPELDVPEGTSHSEARQLVREFVDVGDEVELYDTVMVEGETNRPTGTVVELADEFLVIDTGSTPNGRVRYDDIDRMSVVTYDDEESRP